MPQGLSISRGWLAAVVLVCCLPLFVGLGRADMETDEAIYSFGVERILEAGDWLAPKSSPSETLAFLEKPPLKFWMVAAPIRWGLVPNTDGGLRLVDALLGALAYGYVFALGARLAGPACGAFATLLLAVNGPLLFEHGLRSNSMEASLVLAYAGGTFHALEWARGEGDASRRHALATALYVVLGFMTKFVAVAFLPLSVALGVLAIRAGRQRVAEDWRAWVIAAAVALVLIAPWFLYAHIRFGRELWETMFGQHVVARFTVGLDPSHVHPWSFYVTGLWASLTDTGRAWLLPMGLVALAWSAIRRGAVDAAVLLVWALLPLALISTGTSKLLHYAYPFLPPLTLAMAYPIGLFAQLAPSLWRRVLARVTDWMDGIRGVRPVLAHQAIRVGAGVVFVVAALVFLLTAAEGTVKWRVAGHVLFRSAGLWRVGFVLALSGVFMRRPTAVGRWLTAACLVALVPVGAYAATWSRIDHLRHPMRDAAACVNAVQIASGRPAGLVVDSDWSMWHPITFYFRMIRPWTRQTAPSVDGLIALALSPGHERPALVHDVRYATYLQQRPQALRGVDGATLPVLPLFEYDLLLPGPYEACSPQARLLGTR